MIIKRENGKQYEIDVKIHIVNRYSSNESMHYSLDVYYREKGKRKWTYLKSNFEDDYVYRGLSLDEKEDYKKKILLEHLSAEEINQALLEKWESIKPELY